MSNSEFHLISKSITTGTCKINNFIIRKTPKPILLSHSDKVVAVIQSEEIYVLRRLPEGGDQFFIYYSLLTFCAICTSFEHNQPPIVHTYCDFNRDISVDRCKLATATSNRIGSLSIEQAKSEGYSSFIKEGCGCFWILESVNWEQWCFQVQ